MNQIKVNVKCNDIIIENIECFDLSQTLDCGQAFRWSELPDGRWKGVAFNKCITISLVNNKFTIYNIKLNDFEMIWRNYFDIDGDYGKIITAISKNDVLSEAVKYASGIRILKQDPWETLCSFIISQNNNIPRIKGIISRLCENFGDPIDGEVYSFPDCERIASLTLEDLAPLRSGFRAKYILDAAQKVASGEVRLDNLHTLSLDEARKELIKIYGVGSKVADCVLLFSCGFIDAFPEDVWIKRAMKKLFDGKLPDVAIPYAGIVQQYIFHYARVTKLEA